MPDGASSGGESVFQLRDRGRPGGGDAAAARPPTDAAVYGRGEMSFGRGMAWRGVLRRAVPCCVVVWHAICYSACVLQWWR